LPVRIDENFHKPEMFRVPAGRFDTGLVGIIQVIKKDHLKDAFVLLYR